MLELYKHQQAGIEFLTERSSAGLFWEMGTGKSRTALLAAQQLFKERKIDRVLILAPAAVKFAWREELKKLSEQGEIFILGFYAPVTQQIIGERFGKFLEFLPVVIISYSLLPQKRHVEAIAKWCSDGKTLLVCDESSFLKNRTTKQTKSAIILGRNCLRRWLLTGTPVANSPLDLYSQALVMSNDKGPLKSFTNFYHFRARYAVTQPMRFGGRTFQQVVSYQNIDELQGKFAPYVSRVEKKDCLDLPPKSYSVREVPLGEESWRIYQELRREAMLALPDSEATPEPNAAVRILRLRQLTSGHVGGGPVTDQCQDEIEQVSDGIIQVQVARDVSSEKLEWLVSEIMDGELANEKALIVWCLWRHERERLQKMLATKIEVYRIFGGQQEKNRSTEISGFQNGTNRRVLVAQPHAGGYGLTLTAASTAVYLSNTFSYIDRIQSEDRQHRIGQLHPCLYIDVVAVGPRGQATVDAHVLDCLRAKRDLATMTCAAWRKVLAE